MRVLVTGAAGFVGGHVVAHLRGAGHETVGIDNLHPAAHTEPRMPDGTLLGDVRDPDIIHRALRGVDVVVHQAAMVGMGRDIGDLPAYVSCNDLGTAVLLAAMARTGVTRFVLASSMVVYGEGAYRCRRHGRVRPASRSSADLRAGRFEPVCPRCADLLAAELVGESTRLEPRSGYAATKVAQEHLAGAWARETGGHCIALRYHNVYGPGMPRDTPYSGVAAIFRSCLERGDPPRVFEDGRQLRDFIHVDDVARANVRAVAALDEHGGKPGTVTAYNVASGEPHPVLDVAEALADAFGGPKPEVTGQFRAGDVRHIVASPARATADLGFVAEIPFRAGMAGFAEAPLRS